MFERRPDPAELAEAGLQPEDFAQDALEIWPDNEASVSVFTAMRRQWRVGPGGPYGLDLGVLPEIWRRLKVPPALRDDIFADLYVMEAAALEEMAKQR